MLQYIYTRMKESDKKRRKLKMRPRFKGRKKDIKEENQALIQNSEMKHQRQILNHTDPFQKIRISWKSTFSSLILFKM